MIKRIMSALSAVVMPLLLASCDDSKEYCDALAQRVGDPAVANALERWVDDRSGKWDRIRGPLDGGTRRLPGEYPVTESIDDLPLGFGNGDGAEARLIVGLVGEEERVQSVYFGERHMQGVVVRAADSNDFGPKGRIHATISPRIVVICQTRD